MEFLSATQWETFRPRNPCLLLSPTRVAFLGLKAAALEAASQPLSTLWEWVAGAKPALSKAIPAESPDFSYALIRLAKEAGILPGLVWLPGAEDDDLLSIDVNALRYDAPAALVPGETVALPLADAEDSTITSFRTACGSGVHLALVIGAPDKNTAPLVRVHSSCVTGDLLGSLRCDCGGQLQAALERMKEDAGILLYLHQEGRGIGITNKLRAYALQQRGVDTFAANEQLGFEEDERDFSLAAAMLKSLGYKKIRLLTNNPDKIHSFDDSGIAVVERVGLIAGHTAHNKAYIEAKRQKRGHHS